VQKAWKNLTIRELAARAGASLRMSASSANLLAEKESEITSHRFPFNMPAQNRSAFNWRVQDNALIEKPYWFVFRVDGRQLLPWDYFRVVR
jgi:hypothetical protein